MSAEEGARWRWQTHLQQLAIAEAKAWKRLVWGTGIYFGLVLLFLLGLLLAGSSFYDPVRPARPGAFWFTGMVLQGVSGTCLWLLAIPLLLRFVRWVYTMWRRRRFSSTPGADPGQLPRR